MVGYTIKNAIIAFFVFWGLKIWNISLVSFDGK